MRPDEITTIRQRLGLTKKELAELLDVHPNTVHRWEYGIRSISRPLAKDLRELVGNPGPFLAGTERSQ